MVARAGRGARLGRSLVGGRWGCRSAWVGLWLGQVRSVGLGRSGWWGSVTRWECVSSGRVGRVGGGKAYLSTHHTPQRSRFLRGQASLLLAKVLSSALAKKIYTHTPPPTLTLFKRTGHRFCSPKSSHQRSLKKSTPTPPHQRSRFLRGQASL